MWDLEPDLATPLSELEPLPDPIGSTVFLLNWSAADPQNDIDHFDLQYQEKTASGTSAWLDWQDAYHPMPIPGYARSVWFSGTAGVGYNLRIRAVDRAGSIESWPDQPEVTIALAATCTPDANEIQGQSQANAFLLGRGDFSPVFNFCKTPQDGKGDVDWAAVDARAGETLLQMISPNGGGTAFSISLYNGAGVKLYTRQSIDYEKSVSARWVAPSAGRYFLEIKPLHPEMLGTDMKYQVWYGPGNWIYMPFNGR